MRSRGEVGAGVLNHNDGKTQPRSVARSSLYTDVRCDTTDHHSFDARLAQLLFKLRAREGAPVSLGDDQVAPLHTGLRNNFRGNRRQVGRESMRNIDRKVQKVRQVDPHVNGRRALLTESPGAGCALLHHSRSRVGRRLPADDNVLQVDKNESG